MKPYLRLAAWAAHVLPTPLKDLLYRVRPLARLIRRSLNQAAPTGLTEAPVAAGDLRGTILLLDLQMEKDYWLGTYEVELQQALRDWVMPGKVVYDVGANIGYISLLLARAVGKNGRVFSFEALPGNVKRLQRNVELNHCQERVKVVAGAVVAQPGPVRFLVHPSNSMGKALGSAGRDHPEEYLEQIEVEGIVLDDFAYSGINPPPEVLKMDIEGGEVLAVQGMERILSQARPLLLIELHGHEAALTVWQALERHHYVVYRMQAGYPRVLTLDELDWKAYLVASPEEIHQP